LPFSVALPAITVGLVIRSAFGSVSWTGRHRNWNEGPTNPTDPLHSGVEKLLHYRLIIIKPEAMILASIE
jgi:hypothetical protein